ncbi:MAG: hypothetical protein ABI743_13645 [bacterium]
MANGSDHAADGQDITPPGARDTMQVSIDGHPQTVALQGVSTFGELMARIEADLVPPGRVVTSIALNEEELSGEQEGLLHGFGLEGVASLRLATAEPRTLAIESLIHSSDYLPGLSRGLETSAKHIRAGRMDEGLGWLDDALELLGHFLAVLDGVRTVLRLDFTTIELAPDEHSSVANLQHRLSAQVRELFAAAENEDWMTAAEIAAYELSPLVYQFIAAMPLILERALKETPEFRTGLAEKAAKQRDKMIDEAWESLGEEAEESEGDPDDDLPLIAEEEHHVSAVKSKSGNGHSAPDAVTEEMLDALEDEWDSSPPKREGDGGSKGVN